WPIAWRSTRGSAAEQCPSFGEPEGEPEETNMRKLSLAPLFAGLLLAGAACKDQNMNAPAGDQRTTAKTDPLEPQPKANAPAIGSDALSITGQVAKASDTQVELKSGTDVALKLAVDDKTAANIDGKEAHASQIAEG